MGARGTAAAWPQPPTPTHAQTPKRNHATIRQRTGKGLHLGEQLDQLAAQEFHPLLELHDVRVVPHEAAGGAHVDDALRRGAALPKGVHVRHHVVPRLRLLLLRLGEVDVQHVGLHLRDLLVRDVDAWGCGWVGVCLSASVDASTQGKWQNITSAWLAPPAYFLVSAATRAARRMHALRLHAQLPYRAPSRPWPARSTAGATWKTSSRGTKCTTSPARGVRGRGNV